MSARMHVPCLRSLFTFSLFVLYSLILTKNPKSIHSDIRMVDEQVLSASIRSDKTIPFFLIEPFHFALAQFLISFRLRPALSFFVIFFLSLPAMNDSAGLRRDKSDFAQPSVVHRDFVGQVLRRTSRPKPATYLPRFFSYAGVHSARSGKYSLTIIVLE